MLLFLELKMSTERLFLEFFQSYKGCEEIANLKSELEEALCSFENASNNGFSHSELDVVVDFITSTKLAAKPFKRIVDSLIPVETIHGQAVVKMICWLLDCCHSDGNTSVVKSVLQWLIGLVEYEIVDKEIVYQYYSLFYFILDKKYEQDVCHLLHILTKPKDVQRYRVEKLLCLLKNRGNRKHNQALLCLFKCYKPENVPESVSAVALSNAFPKISLMLQQKLKLCSKRRMSLTSNENQDKTLKWFKHNSLKKSCQALIPPVEYVNTSSYSMNLDKMNPITSFSRVEDVCKNILAVKVPNNSLSLLANKAGRLLLIIGDRTLQLRFSYNLFHLLRKVFILKMPYPENEKEELLNHIVDLYTELQSGIPIVNIFLSEFMATWNGFHYRKQIFELLAWVELDDMEDIHNSFLQPLKDLFMTSDEDEKKEILQCLMKLLHNMHHHLILKKKVKDYSSFLDSQKELLVWKDEIRILSLYIGDLFKEAIILEPESLSLLGEIISFHYQIAVLEDKSRIRIWTVISPIITYKSFFCRTPVFLELVCQLLLKYKCSMNVNLKKHKIRGLFKEELETIQSFAADFHCCLVAKKAFINRGTEYKGLLSSLPRDISSQLSQFGNPNELFDVTRHIAFAPYKLKVKPCSSNLGKQREEFFHLVDTEFKAFAEFRRILSVEEKRKKCIK